MVNEAKLEPGWLTRDVNNAASRAKSLETRAADREIAPQPSASPQQQQGAGSSTSKDQH